ncbi:MAG TPA: DUF2877 domain-containing protein [Methylomirabilota bacterium]|nr:DUF2877 domain-containing protein [Methylomirabilota bacterium]
MDRKPGRRYAATLLGRAARRALATPSGWDVVAVFRRSLYCGSPDGSLICLGPASIGAGPLNVVCDLPKGAGWEADVLEPGAAAEWDGTTFRVDGRFAFELAGAREWRPVPVPGDWAPDVVAASVRAVAAETAACAPADGLARVISTLAPAGAAPPDAARSPLDQLAGPAVTALAGWLRSVRDQAGPPTPGPPSELESLIGLGPGLTPSGDDLLGGAMIALRAFGRPDAAERLADRLLPRARSRTHRISLAHLASAADGEGMAALHALLAALCEPDLPQLHACLDALAAVGHTSGWDALAGASVVAAVMSSPRPGREARWS